MQLIKSKKVVLVLLLCLTLLMTQSSCSKKVTYEGTQVNISEQTIRQLPIELYVEEIIKLGPYEPVNGIYTGAYVALDDEVGGELTSYEARMGQEQTFKVFMYRQKEGIHSDDILRCIAEKKVPYIKIVLGTDYDLSPLYQLLFSLSGCYHVPVFIELYPLTEKAYTPLEYKETYQRAYELIQKYLSQATVVWSSDESRLSDMPLYCPGEAYFDWAGINVYIPRYQNQELYTYEGLQGLDFWYKNFQNVKPMLISGLAISHYSKVDSNYQIYEAKGLLELFYSKVIEAYPRIRGVIYMDVDMAAVNDMNSEDYRLTTQTFLTETMRALFMPLKCLTQLISAEENSAKCYMKYQITGALINNQLYISEDYMSTCFPKVPLRKLKKVQDLTGMTYYAYNDLLKYSRCYYTYE